MTDKYEVWQWYAIHVHFQGNSYLIRSLPCSCSLLSGFLLLLDFRPAKPNKGELSCLLRPLLLQSRATHSLFLQRHHVYQVTSMVAKCGAKKVFYTHRRETMDCVRGIASLPVEGEPTEEVYLVPATGKPGYWLKRTRFQGTILFYRDYDIRILVVGGWGAWSSWQECSLQCQTSRRRRCNQGGFTLWCQERLGMTECFGISGLLHFAQIAIWTTCPFESGIVCQGWMMI